MIADFGPGFNSSVSMTLQGVEKVSLHAFDYDEASSWAEATRAYADELVEEPIDTAQLLDVGVQATPNGYGVRHTLEYVPGTDLHELPQSEQPYAIGGLIRQVAAMSTLRKPNVLRIPIDAWEPNIRVTADGRTKLVDIYPPLLRNNDGSYPIERFSHGQFPLAGERYFSHLHGTKSGVIIGLLAAAHVSGQPKRLSYAATHEVPDWCTQILPDTLDSSVRNRIIHAASMRFVPYFGLRRVINKASGLQLLVKPRT